MMTDIRNYDDVALLVNEFYRRVRLDEIIGPIFLERISDWEPHLVVLRNFWYSVLFAKSAYSGNPFMKHVDLPIQKEHFDRWVSLFHRTVDDMYIGEIATDAKVRAGKMSTLFQAKLNDMRSSNMKPLM